MQFSSMMNTNTSLNFGMKRAIECNIPWIYSGSGGEVRRQNGQLWRAVCGIGKSYQVAGTRLTRRTSPPSSQSRNQKAFQIGIL